MRTAPTEHRASTPRAKIGTAIGLLLIVAYGLGALAHRGVSLGSIHDDLQAIVRDWLLVLILAVIGLGIEKHTPRFFGLRRPGWRDLLALLAFLVVTAVITALVTQLPAVAAALRQVKMTGLAAVPLGVRVALVLTAAACEEFIFRGFLIEEVGAWTGSIPLAACLSLILFVVPHAWIYGFTLALAVPAVLGGSLTLLYLWRRNLPICMLMHAIVDGLPLIVVPLLTRAHGG